MAHSTISMPPYQVYSQVAGQTSRNVVYQLVGTAFVYWLAGVWRTGAQVAFFIFVLSTVLDAFWALFGTGAGVIGDILARKAGEGIKDQRWLWAANAVRLVDVAIACGLLFVLYQRIW